MSEKFIKKNIKLPLKFDSYVSKHPELYDAIPNEAYVVITIEGDKEFSRQSIQLVRSPRRKKIVEAHKSRSEWRIQPLRLQTA